LSSAKANPTNNLKDFLRGSDYEGEHQRMRHRMDVKRNYEVGAPYLRQIGHGDFSDSNFRWRLYPLAIPLRSSSS